MSEETELWLWFTGALACVAAYVVGVSAEWGPWWLWLPALLFASWAGWRLGTWGSCWRVRASASWWWVEVEVTVSDAPVGDRRLMRPARRGRP